MYVKKNFNITSILRFSGVHIIWLSLWSALAICTYKFTGWSWMKIPWLPLSVVGTAVAFYVGFKNNSAYDRLWEARKIWGGIVNVSRMWGANAKAYISNQFTQHDASEYDLENWRKKLIHRHIAWLYVLRAQLLKPTEWEHISQGKRYSKYIEKRRETYGLGVLKDKMTHDELMNCLQKEEMKELTHFKNVATHLIDKQSQDLAELRKLNLIDDFRHMELQKLLNEFYTLQGKCERIKKFPLPRQYGSMSFVFVAIFIFLLPFGMVSGFEEVSQTTNSYAFWLSVPFTVLVGWVFVMMELIGDYSENPFEGLGNDIPMYSLCRTIEIDLRQMLNETDLPPAVEPVNGVLM